MAGMWLQHRDNIEYWDTLRWGYETAMKVNGCPGKATAVENWLDYEVPGLDSAVDCSSIVSSCAANDNGTCTSFVCSASSPMVVCYHGNIGAVDDPDTDTVANLSFAHFFSSFFAP